MKLRAAFVIVLAALFAAGPAMAQKRGNEQPRNDNGNLPESVRKVERETGGDVLRAERRTRDGEEVTRVKVITPQGRVRTVESRRAPEPEKGDAGRKKDDDPGVD